MSHGNSPEDGCPRALSLNTKRRTRHRSALLFKDGSNAVPKIVLPVESRSSQASLRRLGHADLGRLEVGAGVVELLVAHFAVDLEHAVVFVKMWSTIGRVKAYWVSVSMFILTTP